MVDFDKILSELGVVTRPQWTQLLILSLPPILAAAHMTVMVFMGYRQNHTCTMPRKSEIEQDCNISWTEQQTERYIPRTAEDGKFENCERYKYDSINCTFWNSNDTYYSTDFNLLPIEECDSWNYDTGLFATTVVGDFDLVCDNKQKARLSQAIFMLGVVLGTALWGQLSDRFGRKLAVIVPMIIGVAFGIGTAYSQSYLQFTVLRFFIGITVFPSFSCSFVLASETVKQDHKVMVGQTYQSVFAVGICMLSPLAYYVRDWRTIQLCISIPGIIIVLLLWFTFESPRWLLSSKKYVKADEIVKRIMKSNKTQESLEAKQLQALSLLDNPEASCNKEEERLEEDNSKNGTIIEILKLPNMRRKTLVLYYEWMVTSALYYGLTLNSAELGGSVFINLFLSAIVEIPGSYLAVPMLQKWGRRPTLTSTLFVSGIVCVCMMFVSQEMVWLNVTLATIGKFAISGTFGTVYIYTTDLYPTTVRNVGLGICSSWARIGGMLAPFIAMLDVISLAIPYVTFGFLAVIGGFLGLLLPEVLGKKIPETLEEAEEFGKHYEGVLVFICGRKIGDLDGKESMPNKEEIKA